MSEQTQQSIAKGINLVANKLSPVSNFITASKTVTTAGTAEQLGEDISVSWVAIQAKTANTNPVFIGDFSVDSTNGYSLAALESIVLPVANLNLIWLDATTNGEGVNIIYGK